MSLFSRVVLNNLLCIHVSVESSLPLAGVGMISLGPHDEDRMAGRLLQDCA